MNKKLSIVIPCWNCEKTIGRLLDSILDNHLDRNIYDVIICDDKSTDNFMDIVKTYEDKIDLIYCKTTRDFHCPGNTRQAALPYIDGEWFTFIDNDDMFESDVINIVLKYIEDNHLQYTLVTNFREYFPQDNTFGRIMLGEDGDTWLHGKYFNRVNTLEKFKCRFKDDMFSHEDLYFNSWNLACIVNMGRDYDYLDLFTYRWIYNAESLSRSYFNTQHYYIETYLDDYLVAASHPYFDLLKESNNEIARQFAWNQIEMTLLHGFFYYSASVWRLGKENVLPQNLESLKAFKRKMIEELKCSEEDIIKYVYAMPERYDKIKYISRAGSNAFVEEISFKDFIYSL